MYSFLINGNCHLRKLLMYLKRFIAQCQTAGIFIGQIKAFCPAFVSTAQYRRFPFRLQKRQNKLGVRSLARSAYRQISNRNNRNIERCGFENIAIEQPVTNACHYPVE